LLSTPSLWLGELQTHVAVCYSTSIRLPTLDVFQRRCESKIYIHIGCASRFWGNAWWHGAILNARRVFQHKIFFTGAIQTRDWSPIKLYFLTPHFFGGLSYSYVCTNTDIDVVFRGIRMCSACKSSALRPPSSALSFLPLICYHNARPGESRTYTTTPTMSNCYHGSSSDSFHSKQHVK